MTTPPLGGFGSVDQSFDVVSQRDKKYRRNLLVTVIVGVIAFAMLAVGTVVVLFRYSSKFLQADKTRESLSWDGAPGEILHTTYTNPAYGLTLKLPGQWLPSKTPTKFLCHLVGFGRFHAVLETDFPVFTSSVDGDAALVARRYETAQGWTLNSDEPARVSGLPARVLRLTTPRGVDVDLVLVKRWPVVYGLSVAGPAGDSDDWQRVRQALPQSLEIR
jgi:hypothetical protein